MIPPDSIQVAAICTRTQGEVLVRYDHHRVKVENRWGILITYPWMPLEEAQEPLMAKVIFNPAPKHNFSPDQIRALVFKHPLAPPEVQEIIDQLLFKDAGPDLFPE
jgi:hypothetical protein